VVGGILEHCGIPGFLRNTDDLYEQSDIDTPQIEHFVELWYEKWGSEPKTTAEVQRYISSELENHNTTFFDSLPDDLQTAYLRKGFTRSLGAKLRRMCDAVLPNGHKITRPGSVKGAVAWRVVKIETTQTNLTHHIEGEGYNEDLFSTSEETNLTHQLTHEPVHEVSLQDDYSETNSVNSQDNSNPDFKTQINSSSGELDEFTFNSIEEENQSKKYLEYSTDTNHLKNNSSNSPNSLPPIVGDQPDGDECYYASGVTDQPTTLTSWLEHHGVPTLKPPGEYDFVKGGAGSIRCVCRGCNNPPIKTAKGMMPLCQSHFKEYSELWELEHQGGEK
jgi:hypothetical protein